MYFMQEAHRNLFMPITFRIIQDSIIRSFVFLEPWCVIYHLAMEVPEPLPNSPKTRNYAGAQFTERIEPTNETGHVQCSDFQNVWSCVKQQTKQVWQTMHHTLRGLHSQLDLFIYLPSTHNTRKTNRQCKIHQNEFS